MKNRLLLISISVSLLIHVILVGLSYFFHAQTKKSIQTASIEIDVLPKEEQKQIKTREEKKQVVQQEKAINNETDENAKYLSQFNQKVAKETVAINNGKFQNMNSQPQIKSRQSNLVKKPSVNKNFDLSKAMGGIDALEGWRKKQSEEESAPETPDTSISQTDDKIDNTEKGLETVLNSKEFKYYSYHSRIREKLSQHWQPIVRSKLSKLLKKGRYPAASGQDHITSLVIVLNPKGLLLGVKLIGQSGVDDLDDAAVEAFKAAAPFPNPPQGMIEPDGTIKIRWDFVLES